MDRRAAAAQRRLKRALGFAHCARLEDPPRFTSTRAALVADGQRPRARLPLGRGIAKSESTTLCELIDSTDEVRGASTACGQVVSMNCAVLGFRDRRSGVRRKEGAPRDRLTGLCASMTDTLDRELQAGEEVKCVVFLPDGEPGGLQLHGYDDREAIVEVLYRQRRILRANDQDLAIAPIPGGDG